jgi:outer membrane protein TolC
MLGLPEKTRLELVPPHPLVENLSLNQAVAQAQGISPEVIEAEQTAVKARAGSRLAKMEYFPTVAVVGGYTHQNAINAVLPEDFSYIGFTATYTIFDSGKRERDVNERRAQVDAAELGVQLTKAKAAAAVKTAYFELERSREVATFVRRIVRSRPDLANQGAQKQKPTYAEPSFG